MPMNSGPPPPPGMGMNMGYNMGYNMGQGMGMQMGFGMQPMGGYGQPSAYGGAYSGAAVPGFTAPPQGVSLTNN